MQTPNMKEFAMRMLSSNPAVANSPQGKEFLDILKTGDSARGERMAENLCNTYGVSREDAIAQAKRYFGVQ